MEIEGYRWQDLERMAQNRTRWRTVASVAYAPRRGIMRRQVSKRLASVSMIFWWNFCSFQM
jgi:hypothetical protein